MGTQESCALRDWERLLQQHLGPGYVKVAQESLLSISLLVYARAEVCVFPVPVRVRRTQGQHCTILPNLRDAVWQPCVAADLISGVPAYQRGPHIKHSMRRG